MTHHSPAMDAAAGPEGSSVDSGPAQPHNAAINPAWTINRKRL
ncbi:hypothetical protein [Paraburkholderia sp. Cy-641]|nr:hypothetical protein [Paraburkholderia sp. Cy-641]